MFFKRFKIKSLSKKLKYMQKHRELNPVSDEILKKEIQAYHALAKLYISLQGKKKFPFAYLLEIEAYRCAANLNDAEAQFILAKKRIEEGKMREEMQSQGPLASGENERLKNNAFEEGHTYLQAADASGHILAKRYRGLCLINGWGVSVDKDKGFDLIVQSIDLENSWDKVPQIFAAIGLNKPEFFSALAKHPKRN